MSVIAQFKDTCVFPTTAFVFESYLKGDTLLILFKCYHQRPKKSELSGWQNSTRKNFPDEVRETFFATRKCVNHLLRQMKCVKRVRNKKVHKIAI